MVLKEAMRLYSPVPTFTRIAKTDMDLGELKVTAGSMIFIPIYALQGGCGTIRPASTPSVSRLAATAPTRATGISRSAPARASASAPRSRWSSNRHAGSLRSRSAL
jgi:Cytochrome P450